MMMRKQRDKWKFDISREKPATPLLDTINYPLHMKNLSTQELEELARELRADIVYSVSKTGGHLSSSLGVVELAIALHHVFDTPEDKIIWDVGHQAYPHKILTGRRSRMHTIRKTSGLAGFPKRDESIHDAFGAGHSSTSISAGLGMAVARDLLGKNNNVISVIGDGAMTAGQAYEAMNNAGFLDSNLIVVLNDNKQVSLPTATLDGPATPVGALSSSLTKLQASTKFRKLREAAKSITKQIGRQTHEVAAKVDEYARGMISASGSTLFEELGLYYIGPVDGHNVEDLVTIFQKVKAMPAPGPVLIHIVTEKGKGYPPAEAAADKMHGVVKFDPETGKQFKTKSPTLTYTQYFAESLIKEAEADNKIVAIHAAMGGGTGLNYFQKRFPDRCFDVGERVKDKLKEFMGDYTDDTLVEYVIVLLRNGRRKEEARNELNVFLGDDSDSFVSWLWDHLASNLNLYVHPEGSHSNEAAKVKPTSGDKSGSNDSPHLDSETEGGKSNKLSRSRHNREWKGLVRDAAEPQPLRSSEVDDIHFEEKTHREVERGRRSPSPPRPKGQKKRSRTDERQHSKREVGQKTIDAPRRLLQFAVRDAVGTTRPSSSGKEPSLKRLRSVVSTSTGTSELVERPRRIRSVATVPNPLATVIKAVAEAAEDVTRVKSGGNVFDRLGRGMTMTGIADGPAEFREGAVEDEEYENFNQIQEQTGPAYLDRHDYRGQYDGDMTMLDSATVLPFDSMSDNEGYEDVSVTGRKVTDVSQSRLSVGNKGEDSRVQYSIAKNADDIMQISRNKDQHQPVAPMSSSRKVVNISVNVNTWKPPHYQETRDVTALNSRISNQDGDAHAEKSAVQLMKENSNPTTVGNGNAKPAADTQMESQKSLLSAPGLYTTAGRPSEDADSRTIFVSNVHFAATKDSLSRHFNKFGEVLKVVIVTDAATGQPKGSAYVEFMRKEAADNALTLDGTSFMSRILKVVKRNAAHQDAAPLMAWPRIARGSPYAAARFTRAPFPRGLQGAFRPRLPIKPGARSLQWKRDAQATPADSIAQVPGNTIPSPTARSLTYVRSEPKTDGNPGGT